MMQTKGFRYLFQKNIRGHFIKKQILNNLPRNQEFHKNDSNCYTLSPILICVKKFNKQDDTTLQPIWNFHNTLSLLNLIIISSKWDIKCDIWGNITSFAKKTLLHIQNICTIILNLYQYRLISYGRSMRTVEHLHLVCKAKFQGIHVLLNTQCLLEFQETYKYLTK